LADFYSADFDKIAVRIAVMKMVFGFVGKPIIPIVFQEKEISWSWRIYYCFQNVVQDFTLR